MAGARVDVGQRAPRRTSAALHLPAGGTLPEDVWRSRHRGILFLLWFHVPALFVFGLARGKTLGHALLDVSVIAGLALLAQRTTDLRRASTVFASMGLMLSSAVLVHLSGGVIEAHFHFFVMVGVVVLYQDWLPFLVAIAFVVLHHGVMGVISPHDVYDHKSAWDHPWTWAAIHGGSIMAMSVVGIVNWKLNERSQAQVASLAAIVASSSEAIYRWTGDGTIISWNQGAADLYGYSAEEMIGRRFADLVPPERAGEVQRVLDRVREGAHVEAFDTERVGKDGRRVTVALTVSPVRDSDGVVVGGATIARDITERRRAEEALRASEARTRTIIDTARGAFVGTDAAGRITDWNHMAEVMFGWTAEEATGRPLAGTVLPVHPAEGGEGPTGLFRSLGTGDGPLADGVVEATGMHRDGHGFPIEVAAWRVGTGDDEHVSAFIHDITERKRDEQALQETASLLEATLDSTANGILVVDVDGRISTFNRRFAEMWRIPDSVLASGDDRDALAVALDQLQDPDVFVAKVEELYGQPEAESQDTLLFKDGREFERLSKPLRMAGRVAGRVWSFQDVTERKRLEAELGAARDAALESSRMKSEFLATMSHEIRTPMNGVIGLTGLLLDTPLSDTQREYAEGVRASGEALLGIINDILDFSKIEAGKLELEMVDFDLAHALDEVVGLVAEQARAKGLELVAYCHPGVPAMVRGDVGRLRQVLLNLLSNAVKFTATGEVVMRAGVRAAAVEDQVVVHVEVADTGIGIDPETAGRLFQPFSQADASTTRRYGGTGLGLAISRRLTEAMGGTIGLESRVGQGSTFWVDVPVGRPAHEVRTIDPADQPLGGLRVLVVDDNRTNRLVLAAQLLAWNVEADLAPDAYAALHHLRRAAADAKPYALAVVDMGMPGMDGLELGRIVSGDPSLASVRLVLLSSFIVEAEVAAAAGFVARLTKPARLAQLHDALVRAVGSAPAAAAAAPAAVRIRTPGVPKKRLLVVEDNAINQVVAKGLVATLGYGCDVAGNGIEALEALDRQHYDAVLMDCRMPEMDGFEATAQIRRREGDAHLLPIIAMTAGALVEDRERCLAAGMDDYLSKPLQAGDLDRILRRWLAPAAKERGGADDAVDAARLAELRDLDPDDGAALVARLLDDFLAQGASAVATLAAGLEAGDAGTVGDVAHSLKGAARNLGAVEVGRLTADVEAAARADRLADAAAPLAGLPAALERVRRVAHDLGRPAGGAAA